MKKVFKTIINFIKKTHEEHVVFMDKYDNYNKIGCPPNDGSQCVCKHYPAHCDYCHTQIAEHFGH